MLQIGSFFIGVRVAFENELLLNVKVSLLLDPSGPCAGCASAVEVDQEIVNFALAELSYGACEVNSVRVENFKQQVTVVPVSL